MIATKAALKRKIQNDLPVELENPSKIRKVEKIENANNDPESTNGGANSSTVLIPAENNSITKIRRKLSSMLHLKKKYKYYCKKHNVVYLMEKTRRNSRELSKKSRDHLVNRFRSLDVTQHVSVNPLQILECMEVDFDDDDKDLFDQSTFDSVITKCKISRIYVSSDESTSDARKENIPWNNQWGNKISLNQLLHRYILCDESEVSDYGDEGYTEDEECYEPSEDENYILTRSPGGTSVIMEKIKDSSDVSYYEDCCTHHTCALKRYSKNYSYDYDSSFDKDF